VAAPTHTAAAASKTETKTDADSDAFQDGTRRRPGRTAFDDNFVGRRSALRRFFDPLGRRRRIHLFYERQR
jgi:hypothetical protein